MIRHIAFFGVQDPADVEIVMQTFQGYGAIEGVRSIEVARNEKRDSLSGEIDVVLHLTFDDRDALERYKTDPIYLAGIDIVRPRRTIRHVVDYEFE